MRSGIFAESHAVVLCCSCTAAESLITAKVERSPPNPENAAMRHGNIYEAEARQAYERETRQTCVEFGLKPHDRCYLHPPLLSLAWERQGASHDDAKQSNASVDLSIPAASGAGIRGWVPAPTV